MKKLSLRSPRLYLVLSITAAVAAALVVFAALRSLNSRIAESGNLVRLVVAARDLEPGEVLDPSKISTVDFPDRYLLPGTFTDPLELTGHTVAHPVIAGEPLLRSSLLLPGEGGLARGALEEGFRAYPLPSGSVSFPAGELWPGCRVDILVVEAGEARAALRNIEVLGVSRNDPADLLPEQGLYGGSGAAEECIFLQITPEEACILAAVQDGGKIELVLQPDPES